MTTAWTETAQQICTDALEHLGAIGANETPSAADMQTALRGLDAVLKELPTFGYSWPKLSGDVVLTWAIGTPQTIALPADYFNYPVVRKTVASQDVPLSQIPHAQWIAMTDRTVTAAQPTHFYISTDKTLYFWPVPTADPVAKLQYQKIIDDAASTSAPDVLQIWINPLGYGVANEIGLKFSVDQPTRLEIAQRWQAKRDRALESSISSEVIVIDVDG